MIDRYVSFAGWDGINPEGKAEFTSDSTCPPDRDGLGWQIYRDGKKRPRRTYRAKMADTFVGPCDERTTQSARGGRGWSSGSDTEYDEKDPPPDRPSPLRHHNSPNHHNMPYPREYRPTPPPSNTHYESMGGNFMPSLVFPSERSDHNATGDDNKMGEYSRNVAWYSGPVMITKGPYQPRESTAREVDELQAHANMMFFYKGRQNIVLNTNPTFHPTEYHQSQYDIDMHDQCRRRQEVAWQRSHHAQLRGVEPTGNCNRCWRQYELPVSANHNAHPIQWAPTDQ